MASFVEQATLIVDDKSSKNLNNINAAVRRLEKSAKSLQKTLNGFEFKMKQPRLTADLNKLQKQLNGFKQVKPLTLQVNSNQVTAAIQKVQQLKKLMNQSQKQLMLPVQNPQNPRNPRMPQNLINPASNAVHVRTDGLQRILNGFIERLGNTIETAIINGFQKGYQSQDIADTRYGLLNVTGEQREQARASARDISKQVPVVSTSDVENMFGENLVVAKNNMDAAKAMTLAAAKFIEFRRSVTPNASMDQLVDQAVLISKAGEQSGKITDNEGNIDPKKLTDFYDLIYRASIMLGKEIDPKLVRDTFRVSGSSKFGLDRRGILTLLALAEEQGSGAGVDVNQLIRQLSGYSVTKKAISKQIEYGLSDYELVETGKVGDKPVKERMLLGPKNQELLTANPLQWVFENIFPAMRKAGFDPNSTDDAIKFANEVTSHGRARAGLTALINRAQDIQKTIDMAEALNMDPERLKGVLGDSGLLAMQEASSQVIGLAGQIATAFEGPLIKAMNLVRDTAISLSDFIAGPDGQGSATNGALVAGGAVVAGVAAVKGGGALLGLLNPFRGFGTSVTQFQAAVNQFSGSVGAGSVGNGPGGNKGKGIGRPGLSNLLFGIFGAANLVNNLPDNPDDLQKFMDENKKTWEGYNSWLESALGNPRRVFNQLVGLGSDQTVKTPDQMSAEVTNLVKEINTLTAQMQTNKDLGMPEGANQLLNNQVQTLFAQLANTDPNGTILASLTTSKDQFAEVFGTGAAQLSQSGDAIRMAANEAGPTMGQGILGVATQFGTTAGAVLASAIQGALSNISVNARVNPVQATPALDTGATGNPL